MKTVLKVFFTLVALASLCAFPTTNVVADPKITDDPTPSVAKSAGIKARALNAALIPTSTTFTITPNPSLKGVPYYTFSATVTSGGSPLNVGVVTFSIPALGYSQPVFMSGSNGLAIYYPTPAQLGVLAEGRYEVKATYFDDKFGGPVYDGSSATTILEVNNPTTVNGTQFCNSLTGMTLNAGGPSSPYPSNIFVSNTGPIQGLTVSLNGLTSSNPSGSDLLLVGPGGQKFVLMSDVGGTNPVSGVNLVFSDAAANAVPGTSLSSGTYRPTDNPNANVFASPAPAGPYSSPAPTGGSTLTSVFGNTNPNGNWSLYWVNDAGVTGSLSGGWCLNITAPPSLSINDVSQVEGNSGTTILRFTVNLTKPAPAGGVTFDIATADNTATTANNDYVARSLTAQTIPAGSDTYTFDVEVNGDNTPEYPETFFVNVSNVTGAYVVDAQGVGTITNDDCQVNPVVTNLNDNGSGSLREAIYFACPGSTITFANGVTGTINLTGGQLAIDKNLTIEGPGADLLNVKAVYIDVYTPRRVIYVGNVVATLKGITISGGYNASTNTNDVLNGAGIYNAGQLTIERCVVANNEIQGCSSCGTSGDGAGIFNSGTLVISNSHIKDNTNFLPNAFNGGSVRGGGIANIGGSLTLVNSTLSGNIGSGGGLYNAGTAYISNSTVRDQPENGITQVAGILTLLNSTISGNGDVTSSNGGGILLTGGTATINFCTITGNKGYGGGIYNSNYSLDGNPPTGSFTIRNSILAGNNGPQDPIGGGSTGDYYFPHDPSIPPAGYPRLTSLGNNLFGNVDAPLDWTFNGPGDLLGNSASPINPLLGALADNGVLPKPTRCCRVAQPLMQVVMRLLPLPDLPPIKEAQVFHDLLTAPPT